MSQNISSDSYASYEPEWGHLPSVTWESNTATKFCRRCEKKWSKYYRWKHHCRYCGQLVCDSCSYPREQYAHFSKPVRTCWPCSTLIRAIQMEEMHHLDFDASAHNAPWEILYFGSNSTTGAHAQEKASSACINALHESPPISEQVEQAEKQRSYGAPAVTSSPKSLANDETDEDSEFALDASPAGRSSGGFYRHVSLHEIGARPRVISQEAQSESTMMTDEAAAVHASADSRDLAHKLSFYRTESFDSFVA